MTTEQATPYLFIVDIPLEDAIKNHGVKLQEVYDILEGYGNHNRKYFCRPCVVKAYKYLRALKEKIK